MTKIVAAIVGCVLVLITASTALAQDLKAQQPKPAPIVQQAQQWQNITCQRMFDTFVSFYGMTDQQATQQTREAGCEK